MLRAFFIFLSQRKFLRRWMENSKLARPLTRRFIAGNSLEEALAVCSHLNALGILTTLDPLGESVSAREEAERSRDHALEAIRQIAARRLQSTISVKLTQLGLDIDTDFCLGNARALVQLAQQCNTRVEFDMETSGHTDRTLAIVHQLHGEFPHCVRAVIQAYLFRSEADIVALNQAAIPVRLCKGAYAEDPSLAFAEKSAVDNNYRHLTQLLLQQGAYPAIATHDPKMIAAAQSASVPKDSFEFQMLYGVRRDLQRQLAAQGYRLRLYVPYGEAWYPYFMRRLAERPANVLFLARNFFQS